MRANVQIIAENDALSLRIVLRRGKSRPVVIDHNAEIDRSQHRHERCADVPAAEDIRIARPRERLDVIARLPLFVTASARSIGRSSSGVMQSVKRRPCASS